MSKFDDMTLEDMINTPLDDNGEDIHVAYNSDDDDQSLGSPIISQDASLRDGTLF